jgi:hypothetical protein
MLTDENWSCCSFCGRKGVEVRPHPPFNDEWRSWKFLPLRLCFFCAEIQDNLRKMLESFEKKDGN